MPVIRPLVASLLLWLLAAALAQPAVAGGSLAFNPANNRLNGGAYDSAGNLHAYAGLADSMAYDVNNKMTSFRDSSNNLLSTGGYVYDGQEQRVQRTAREGSGPQVTTTYVYDAFGKLAAEYSSAAPASTGGTFYRTTDHLGSTRLVTYASGAACEARDFYPFGERIASSIGARPGVAAYASSCGFAQQFTGKERDDESGLDYFGARYYGSSLGRVTSPDASFADQVQLGTKPKWNGGNEGSNARDHHISFGIDSLRPER